MGTSDLVGKHIISYADIGDNLDDLFRRADVMRRDIEAGRVLDTLRGKVLACVFYEASTRTYASFLAAMQRLGGGIIPIQGVEFSSVSKGEVLEDTMRTLEVYSDVLVLRHPETGSARIAADVMTKPLINAGDGTGEHPTQAFLDAYTIASELGRDFCGTITMLGDLESGRTVHSLAHLLVQHFPGVTLRFVAPPEIQMPKKILEDLDRREARYSMHGSLSEVLCETDVLYVTRLQRERYLKSPDLMAMYERIKGTYDVVPQTLQDLKQSAIILHPFPRVGEIALSVDTDPRAAYFRQMKCGLYVRMALLSMVLGA